MKQQQLLEKLVTRKVNQVFGSYENMILDGLEDSVPILKEALDEIYNEVVNSATKEVRFLGTAAIKLAIATKVFIQHSTCEYLSRFELSEIYKVVDEFSK